VQRREFGAVVAMSAMSLLDVMRGHSAELPERVARGSRVDGEAAAGLANVVLVPADLPVGGRWCPDWTRCAGRSACLPSWLLGLAPTVT
jgi:hypothetical protein